MPPINKIAKQITADFAAYTFARGNSFSWSPDREAIFHPSLRDVTDLWSLLHEIAHGELGHTTYLVDIELVTHESHAWEYAAKVLAPRYLLVIDDDYIQDHLDTYREWLHKRSLCPTCGQTGVQTKNTYSCVNCRCLWRANEARLCALRRTKLPNRSQTSKGPRFS